jgi:outer membrane protein assembly factor BamB
MALGVGCSTSNGTNMEGASGAAGQGGQTGGAGGAGAANADGAVPACVSTVKTRLRWSVDISHTGLSEVLLAKGNVVLATTTDGVLTAWHATTGDVLWTAKTAVSDSVLVLGPDSDVYAIAQNGDLVAVDIATGAVRWVVAGLSSKAMVVPSVSTVYAANEAKFCAYAANNGTQTFC